jgi:hypothetical protein
VLRTDKFFLTIREIYDRIGLMIQGGADIMATETFYKRIILSDEAAEKLAIGLEKPRMPYVPRKNMFEELKRSDEWLRRKISESEKS